MVKIKKLLIIFVVLLSLCLSSNVFALEQKTVYFKTNARVGILQTVGSITTQSYEWEYKGQTVIIEIKSCVAVNGKKSGKVLQRIKEFLYKRDMYIPMSSVAWISDDKYVFNLRKI